MPGPLRQLTGPSLLMISHSTLAERRPTPAASLIASLVGVISVIGAGAASTATGRRRAAMVDKSIVSFLRGEY